MDLTAIIVSIVGALGLIVVAAIGAHAAQGAKQQTRTSNGTTLGQTTELIWHATQSIEAKLDAHIGNQLIHTADSDKELIE